MPQLLGGECLERHTFLLEPLRIHIEILSLRQVDGCAYLMTDNLLCIIKLCLCKQKTLQLQFVSCDVVLQHRPLFSASLHLFDDFFRQLNVLSYHLQLVLQFAEVEVETSQQEPYLLTILLYIKLCQLTPQLCHFNA